MTESLDDAILKVSLDGGLTYTEAKEVVIKAQNVLVDGDVRDGELHVFLNEPDYDYVLAHQHQTSSPAAELFIGLHISRLEKDDGVLSLDDVFMAVRDYNDRAAEREAER